MLDIFNNNAFSTARLTQAVNEMKQVPGRISSLGLFETNSVDTTTVAVEKQNDVLSLVPPSPRGAPGSTMPKQLRDMRSFFVPHFEANDAIYAEEVQNIRAMGQEQGLENVMQKVAQRQQKWVNSFDATEELARMGAVQGIVTYSDGSTLNLFTEFGVSQPSAVAFDLLNATPAAGALRKVCASVTRQITVALGGVPFSGIRAFCGDNFFDALLAHAEVRGTYLNWNEAQILRDSYLGADRSDVYGIFMFGGIIWENYRGSVGSTSYIGTDNAHFFPTGVPGLFRTVYAPADYIDTVNTMGQRLYSRQYPMPNLKGVNLDVQMNALQYCSRPQVLLKGTKV